MSGDLGAEVVVRAANACLERHPNLDLILVGDEEELHGHVMRIVGTVVASADFRSSIFSVVLSGSSNGSRQR